MSPLLRLGTYDSLVTAVVFLGILLTCGLTPMQGDTWWQLRAGQDMWLSKQVMLSDTYSHTAAGAFWPNHEWLAEVVFYLTYQTGGLPLLTLFCALLIAWGWALTWRLTRAPADEKFLWVGVALVASAAWWEPRPHAFSLLFIPGLVFVLATDRLLLLPPMFLVWANVHGGVLLGLVLLGASLAAQTVVDPRRWRRSVVVLAACVLAMVLTPLGLSFWTEIPRSLQRINQYTLDEWTRPALNEPELLPFWGMAVLLPWIFIRNIRRLTRLGPGDAALCASAVLLLPAALLAVRNVGPFLMVAVPAATRLMRRREAPRTAPVQRPLLNLTLIALAIVGVTATLAWAYTRELPRLKWHPVPEGAIVALRDCPDNLYNRYDEGGPLLWFVPEKRVFLDGRQDPYPVSLVLEHIRMETTGAPHKELFERHGIHCAYLPVVSPIASQLLAEKWRTLYSDSQWLVLAE